LTLVAVLFLSPIAAAADWPQWLGPTRDGASSEKVAPWTEKPTVVWHIPAGEGHSSPIVADGRAYLHFRRARKDSTPPEFEEVLAAFDVKTGKPLFEQPCGNTTKFKSLFGNGPRATPCVVDGRVYTLGVTGILTCFDAKGGKVLWQKDVLTEFKAPNLFFGISGSPLVLGDHVVINVGGPGASIVAFDRKTGAVAWKKLDDPASYSSPIAWIDGGQRQAIFLTGKGLESLNPADGSVFWGLPFSDKLNESATTPVRIGDLLVAGTITSGSMALRMENKSDKPGVKEVWKNPDLTCYFSTPVPIGSEFLYMVTGVPSLMNPEAKLHCVEAATGKVKWTRGKVGKYHACLIRTGDNKMLMLEEGGDLVLFEPNPKEFRELARAKVCGETWAHPALADGKLYVRDAKELICLELSKNQR
jgi:outer membrane protein assembly factor BamB